VISVRELELEDYDLWRDLWDQYLLFYETSLSEAVTLSTWRKIHNRGGSVKGFLAQSSQSSQSPGVVVGIAHCFLRQSTWHEVGYLYLEDLFVAPSARGEGVGRALLDTVVEYARSIGAERVYWLTKEDNQVARALYDSFNGGGRSEFIHYEYLL
jgi:ribosomal protein S18 acetylase RimI-like enzyme